MDSPCNNYSKKLFVGVWNGSNTTAWCQLTMPSKTTMQGLLRQLRCMARSSRNGISIWFTILNHADHPTTKCDIMSWLWNWSQSPESLGKTYYVDRRWNKASVSHKIIQLDKASTTLSLDLCPPVSPQFTGSWNRNASSLLRPSG